MHTRDRDGDDHRSVSDWMYERDGELYMLVVKVYKKYVRTLACPHLWSRRRDRGRESLSRSRRPFVDFTLERPLAEVRCRIVPYIFLK